MVAKDDIDWLRKKLVALIEKNFSGVGAVLETVKSLTPLVFARTQKDPHYRQR
jgi:hypothetical protein